MERLSDPPSTTATSCASHSHAACRSPWPTVLGLRMSFVSHALLTRPCLQRAGTWEEPTAQHALVVVNTTGVLYPARISPRPLTKGVDPACMYNPVGPLQTNAHITMLQSSPCLHPTTKYRTLNTHTHHQPLPPQLPSTSPISTSGSTSVPKSLSSKNRLPTNFSGKYSCCTLPPL